MPEICTTTIEWGETSENILSQSGKRLSVLQGQMRAGNSINYSCSQESKKLQDQINGSLSQLPSVEYSVKRGDTLLKITRENGISFEKIFAMNEDVNLRDDPDRIFVGQKLNLPNREIKEPHWNLPAIKPSAEKL